MNHFKCVEGLAIQLVAHVLNQQYVYPVMAIELILLNVIVLLTTLMTKLIQIVNVIFEIYYIDYFPTPYTYSGKYDYMCLANTQ